MYRFRGQAQLEYALLIGAIIAAMIAIVYARRTDFSRIPDAISTAGNLGTLGGGMTQTD